MKPLPLATILASIAALLFTAGLWLTSTPPSELRAKAEIAVHVERARRLLGQFDLTLEQNQLLVDSMAGTVDVDLENLDELAEDEEFVDFFQATHEQSWNEIKPVNWHADPPRAERPPGYGDVAGLVRRGLSEQQKLEQRNSAMLGRALQEIDAAMAVSGGAVSGRDDAEANHLKSIVLFHQGLTQAMQARMIRGETAAIRQQLTELAGEVFGHHTTIQRAEGKELAEEVHRLEQRLEERSKEVEQQKSELAALERSLGRMDADWSAARARLDEAQTELEALRTHGLDFTRADASAAFEQQFLELDRRRREAEREVQSLQYGDMPAAHLDPGADPLKAPYVESGSDHPTIARGMETLKADRAVLAAQINEWELEFQSLREEIRSLTTIKEAREGLRRGAEEGIALACSQARELMANLNGLAEEAAEAEGSALTKFEQSAKSAESAMRLAASEVGKARERAEGVSAEALPRSPFKLLQEDTSMEAAAAAQQADALLAAAWVRLHQYRGEGATATCVQEVGEPLQLADANADEFRAASDEARTAGVEAIGEAMKALEQAHRKGRRHWTFVAQQAGANHLLALFGYSEYRKDALEAYRSAMKGRENEAFVGLYNDAVAKLESP